MTVDTIKLARLRGRLAAEFAAVRGIREKARDYDEQARHISAPALADMRVGYGTEVQWQRSQGLEALLLLSPEKLADMRVDIPSVRAAAQLQAEARDLTARADAMQPSVDALAQLVAACEKYVAEVTQ